MSRRQRIETSAPKFRPPEIFAISKRDVLGNNLKDLKAPSNAVDAVALSRQIPVVMSPTPQVAIMFSPPAPTIIGAATNVNRPITRVEDPVYDADEFCPVFTTRTLL